MKVTVVGAGKSGLAAAILAKKQGEDVIVTDAKSVDELGPVAQLLDSHDIPLVSRDSGIGTRGSLLGARDSLLGARDSGLVIVSPGVPPTNPLRKEFSERGIPIIGEMEYASRFLKNRMVAITGTNGKTTTTALTAHVLNGGGIKAVTAGNIGTPLSSLVGEVDDDTVIVIEASSYQLDTIVDFRPYVSMILNI